MALSMIRLYGAHCSECFYSEDYDSANVAFEAHMHFKSKGWKISGTAKAERYGKESTDLCPKCNSSKGTN